MSVRTSRTWLAAVVLLAAAPLAVALSHALAPPPTTYRPGDTAADRQQLAELGPERWAAAWHRRCEALPGDRRPHCHYDTDRVALGVDGVRRWRIGGAWRSWVNDYHQLQPSGLVRCWGSNPYGAVRCFDATMTPDTWRPLVGRSYAR